MSSMNVTERTAQLSPLDVADGAKELLKQALGSSERAIFCEFQEGLLILRGHVSSYYHKQLAQERVAKLPAVEQVVNHLQVKRLLA